MLKSNDIFKFKGEEYQVPVISDRIYDVYIKTVKDKEHLTKEEVVMKLTQYIALGNLVFIDDRKRKYFRYGNLFVTVDVNNEVVWIKNHKGSDRYNSYDVKYEDKVKLKEILFNSENDNELEIAESMGLLHNLKNRIFGFKAKEVKAKC